MIAASFGRTEPRHEKVPLHDQCPVCDTLADHLITAQNAAFLLIDYQPAQLAAVRSMDHAPLASN